MTPKKEKRRREKGKEDRDKETETERQRSHGHTLSTYLPSNGERTNVANVDTRCRKPSVRFHPQHPKEKRLKANLLSILMFILKVEGSRAQAGRSTVRH